MCAALMFTVALVATVTQAHNCQSDSVIDAKATSPDTTTVITVSEPDNVPKVKLTTNEKNVLLKIAMAEAEGEPLKGKALVMAVVLNRTKSEGFPDSVEDVVFQTINGVYQFSPVEEYGRYWTAEPNEDCYKALKMITDGWDESKGALYFEACTGETWQSQNCEYLFKVGNHRFYK